MEESDALEDQDPSEKRIPTLLVLNKIDEYSIKEQEKYLESRRREFEALGEFDGVFYTACDPGSKGKYRDKVKDYGDLKVRGVDAVRRFLLDA